MFNTRVLIPSGKCPVDLNGTSEEEVRDWIESLKRKIPENCIYEPSVYRYWSQRFYSYGSDEYYEVDENISVVLQSYSRIGDLMEKNFSNEKG